MYRNYLYTCINNTVFIEYKFRTIVLKTIDNSQYNKYNFSLFRLSLEITLSKKKVPYFFSFLSFNSFFLFLFLSFFIMQFLRELWEILSIMHKNIVFPITRREIKLALMTLLEFGVNQTSTLCFLVFSQNHVLFGEWGFAPIAKYK